MADYVKDFHKIYFIKIRKKYPVLDSDNMFNISVMLV